MSRWTSCTTQEAAEEVPSLMLDGSVNAESEGVARAAGTGMTYARKKVKIMDTCSPSHVYMTGLQASAQVRKVMRAIPQKAMISNLARAGAGWGR